MIQTNVEKGYQILLEAVSMLQKSLDTSFFDAYIENGENILNKQKVRVIDGIPNKETVQKVEALYQQLSDLNLTQEDKRKLSQLVLLKGIKEESVQANHQLTPDSIGFLFTYLIEQLLKKKKKLSLLDVSVGTGNLLYTVMANLQLANIDTVGFGIDMDDTMLSIASVNREWFNLDVQLFHQDTIDPLLVDPVDICLSDLPVGFYSIDEKASGFNVFSPDEHTYAHHLLMEKAMQHVKESGFGLFLLPSNFLETNQAPLLTKWLKETVYLQAVLKLPSSLFSQKSLGKSIVIVQNKGEHATQAKEVLLAELPSLKDNQAVLTFFNDFHAWHEANIN